MGLRLKFNLVLLVVFLLGLAATGSVSWGLLQRNARDEVVRNATLMMETALAIRSYTVAQVRPQLELQLTRAFLPQSVPAFAATETLNQLKKKYPDYFYKEATLNPTNPRNRASDWEADLAQAVALAPAHVSTYALTYEPGTPFHAWRARGRLCPVDEDLEAGMGQLAAERLGSAGYERYEISSYARSGFAARHNLSYWDGSDYLGLGAGAHSFSQEPAPGVRSTNERLPERYLAAVGTTGTAVASVERLTEATARAEFCFTGLRQTVGIDVASFHRRFGTELAAAFPHVSDLIGDGLLDLAAGRLRLTPRGLAFADTVSATFV